MMFQGEGEISLESILKASNIFQLPSFSGTARAFALRSGSQGLSVEVFI